MTPDLHTYDLILISSSAGKDAGREDADTILNP
jgi:hypothetical protein